jgi:adenylosuccinate lyase
MTFSALNAISPIDGRYLSKTRALSPYFSEFALTYYRLMVEIRWLESLAANEVIQEVPKLSDGAKEFLNQIIANFDEKEAQKVKEYERQTNHDVKALEYYLRDKCKHQSELYPISGFIHFACTSEDINNVAYALMVKRANA